VGRPPSLASLVKNRAPGTALALAPALAAKDAVATGTGGRFQRALGATEDDLTGEAGATPSEEPPARRSNARRDCAEAFVGLRMGLGETARWLVQPLIVTFTPPRRPSITGCGCAIRSSLGGSRLRLVAAAARHTVVVKDRPPSRSRPRSRA